MELARVVRPGGTVASLEFGVPSGAARPLWEVYVRGGLPLAGRLLRHGWREVGEFLGGSIRSFWAEYPIERQLMPGEPPGDQLEVRRLSPAVASSSGAGSRALPASRPSRYALERGGWRDYVTLLHAPYTAWHLSYVVIGGRLAPAVAWGRSAPPSSHRASPSASVRMLDELRGRPLETKIPSPVLMLLAAFSIGAACAIGVIGGIAFRPWLVLLVPLGLFLVLAYNLELLSGRFHSDLWFGLAWGGFPVICGFAAVAGELRVAALIAAAFAVLLSLAQRALSNHVRFVRRRVQAVSGELELRDGGRESLDVNRLIAAEERGLRLLAAALSRSPLPWSSSGSRVVPCPGSRGSCSAPSSARSF